MNWKPATIVEVQQIVERDLANCSRDQVALFKRYGVQPHLAPTVRWGIRESVVVVAQRGAGSNMMPVNERLAYFR